MNLIVQLIITVVAALVSTLLTKQPELEVQEQRQGVRGSTTTGTKPATFIIGKYATAGHRIYPRSSWTGGGTDAVPNEFGVDVIGLSMLPVRSLDSVIVNGETVTLDTENEHASRGYPVEEYRDDDVDHLWVKFYDGTQTTADSYLVDKFGSHPDRPWRSTHVGKGISYVIVTRRANREFFPGYPKYKFVVNGYELNDTRDGENEQENNAVAIRTLLSGISYNGKWFYGPQDIDADYQLPTSNWETGMDVCDESVNRKGGGSDKRFRCGMEISVDEPLIDVINELLKGCNGRMTNVAGRYKILVGSPGSSVKSITDDDIIASHPISLDQFPGMQDTHNGIRAQYVCPEEAWNMKDAPPRIDSDFVAEDDGRELIHNETYRAVWDQRQCQRLMRAALRDNRRFAQRVVTLGPEFFEYEPLDVITWTSTREGYSSKKFLITAIEDTPDGLTVVGLREIDPDDYDWTPDDDELPFTFTVVSQSRPAQQTASGFSFAPESIKDESGGGWRPTIEVTCTAGLSTIRAVEVHAQIRTGTSPDTWGPKATYYLEYDKTESAPYEFLLDGTFKPNQLYRVRARYLTRGKRRNSAWSSWSQVTTPNILIEQSDLSADVSDLLDDISDDYDDLATLVASLGATASNFSDLHEWVYSGTDNEYAIVRLAKKTYVDQNFATASALNQVSASVSDATAGGLLKFEASASRTDEFGNTISRLTAHMFADNGTTLVENLFFMEANAATDLATTCFVQDRFFVATSINKNANVFPIFAVQGGEVIIDNARIKSLTSDNIDVNEVLTVGNVVISGKIKPSDWSDKEWHKIDGTIIGDGVIGTNHIMTGSLEAKHAKIRVFDAEMFRGDGLVEYFEAVHKHRNESFTRKIANKVCAHSKLSDNGAQFINCTARLKYQMRYPNSFDPDARSLFGFSVRAEVWERKWVTRNGNTNKKAWRRIERKYFRHTGTGSQSGGYGKLDDDLEQELSFSFNHRTGHGNVRWDSNPNSTKKSVEWQLRIWATPLNSERSSQLEIDYQESSLVIQANHPLAKRTRN